MSPDSRPPLTTTTSLWPAATIVVAAVAMLVVFTLINVVFDRGVTTTTTSDVVIVGGLTPATVSPVETLCGTSNVVPKDIASGLLVPRHTTLGATSAIVNQGAGDFDCRASLSTNAASAGEILAFYEAHLTNLGWNLFSHGGAGTGQSLFQRAGSDGFYWVLGVTTESTSAGTTAWRLRIYQNSALV